MEPQTQGLECAILIDRCCLLANSCSPDQSFIQICMLRNKDRKWETHVWIFILTAYFFCQHKANYQRKGRWQEILQCLRWSQMMWTFINPVREVIWSHSHRGQSLGPATEQGLSMYMRADACQNRCLDQSRPDEGLPPCLHWHSIRTTALPAAIVISTTAVQYTKTPLPVIIYKTELYS